MENKILVADDSHTIQKVIKITLGTKDYILDFANDEKELFEKIDSNEFSLVLLDYNLSDTASGIDLAKQIRAKRSKTKVMAMLGTFDSVDDIQLETAGVSDKVIKPFESSKFISKIENILSQPLEESLDEDIFSSKDSEDVNDSDEEDFDSDEWSMDGPDIINDHEDDNVGIEELKSVDEKNPLKQEISGWGMSVPEVIGSVENTESGDDAIFPPSIESNEVQFNETNNTASADEPTQEESIEINEINESDESLDFENDNKTKTDEEIEAEAKNESNRNLQLTSLDELQVDDEYSDDEDELDLTDPQLILEPEEDSPDLVNSINDEISPDDFWAADVSEDSEENFKEDEIEAEQNENDENEEDDDDDKTEKIDLLALSNKSDEEFNIKSHISLEDQPKTNELDETSRATLDALSSINEIGPKLETETREAINPSTQVKDNSKLAQEIKEEILADLRPMIKEMIKEALVESRDESNIQATEKVAWEVIPDLAENLIKKEVQEISQRVLNKHSLN